MLEWITNNPTITLTGIIALGMMSIAVGVVWYEHHHNKR